ncbi:hypothetical protein N781_17150 [Pontibacillus halophilus JSM 076056 = DSM 19796]|uniref:Uncharacterized protein n=1 Tax=Pontibacillus halophilus JSM 076056 = DSM 19796 TaxID=1385510 RepID=A0A0A5GN14_9BACI|nr:hypothetical protein [Pontibacillus halophilus]KGX92525.1 hypothetical protein N781_17150 [Pontibacillus halophilus JSM 076056 = DSM 19796]
MIYVWVLLVVYIGVGVLYTWKVSGVLGYFLNKAGGKQKQGIQAAFNPLTIIWLGFEAILVLLWLPLFIYDWTQKGST